MKNCEKAQTLAELKAISAEQFLRMEKDVLSDIIYDLNRNKSMTFKAISELTGMPISTLSNLANPNKQDITQNAARSFNRSFKKANKSVLIETYDLNELIAYFKRYKPLDAEERLLIRVLITILMDCVKR